MSDLRVDDVRVALDPEALAEWWRTQSGVVAKELLRLGYLVEGAAKRYCPVDTGRLRSSITTLLVGVDDPEVYVGTDVEYGPYVEFGTYRMEPQSFLRRAFDEVMR